MSQPERPFLHWKAGLLASVLWILSGGAFGLVTWFGLLPHQFALHLVPETISAGIWHWPAAWPAMAALGSGLVVFATVLLLARIIGRPVIGHRLHGFLALWFVVIVAGCTATAPWAISLVIWNLPPMRAAFVLEPAGSWMLQSAYWGLLWGWLPALVAARVTGTNQASVASDPVARSDNPSRSDSPSRSDYPSRNDYPSRSDRPSRRAVLLLAATLVAAIAVSATAFGFGARSARLQSAADAAIDAGHTIGALPDPDVVVTPPPSIAPGTHPVDDAWCGTDDAILLLGEADAATGHRSLAIRANNVTEAPCVLDGYPDFAFADQNGSMLEVTIDQGGSFMTDDPGPASVTLPPGGYAIVYLGWDAMPTADATVAYSLHAALYPGAERGSWPIALDIVAGGEVAVTAWQIATANAATP